MEELHGDARTVIPTASAALSAAPDAKQLRQAPQAGEEAWAFVRLPCQAEEAFALHDEMTATISKLCASLARKKAAGISVCSAHVQQHFFVKVAG